jgi:fumarylpyruvate hydrolase
LNVWSRDFWLTINDMEVQRGNMDQMVFDIPALIAYLSSRLPLTPGDLIYTGTPSGVGALESGDELILGLGEEFKGKFEVESALR